MNTLIEYLYRDASNYKQFNSAVVSGELTEAQIHEIMGCLEDGEYFIPSQVGLPEKKFDTITEDDHPWFELYEHGFSKTSGEATVKVTAQELYQKFLKCKGAWDSGDLPETDAPAAETPAKISPVEADFDWILQFVAEEDDYSLRFRQQLRCLWTTFCLKHNYEPDTYGYDNLIQQLFQTVKDHMKGPAFKAFDLFMGKYLS